MIQVGPFYDDRDDIPDDVLEEALAERRRRRGSGFCRECFVSGGHNRGCPNEPEDDTDEDAE